MKIGLKIIKEYRNMIAHGHKIFNDAIYDTLPKKQVLNLSKGMLTKVDYTKGLGRKDFLAVIIILVSLLENHTKDQFINELIMAFPTENIILSSNKSLLSTFNLPEDFLDRIKKLK